VKLLETVQLSKHYGGLSAVNGVSLAIEPGHVVGLVGPNGAGKTTLFNLLTGFVRPSSGRIYFKGEDVTPWPPERRAALGLARTFQRSRVFPDVSVAENVRMGCFLRDRAHVRPWRRGPPTQARVDELVARTGLDAYRDARAGTLSFGYQRRLEIAIALGTDPDLILLDEPFGGLSPESAAAMAGLIRELHADGLTFLLIEHRMESIVTACNRLFVMRAGRLIIPHPAPEEVARVER